MLRRALERLTNDWALKATALALAFLLWTNVRRESPGEWSPQATVIVQNTDADWAVAERVPEQVTIVLRGPFGELLRAASDPPRIVIPVEEVGDPSQVHVLRADWVEMPSGTENTVVAEFRPATVRLVFDRVAMRLIPLAATLRDSLPPGYELGRITVEPSHVRARGSRRLLDRIDSLRLPPIDLAALRQTDSLQVTIDTTGTGVSISSRVVRVIVPVRPALSDTGALPLNATRRRPGG